MCFLPGMCLYKMQLGVNSPWDETSHEGNIDYSVADKLSGTDMRHMNKIKQYLNTRNSGIN